MELPLGRNTPTGRERETFTCDSVRPHQDSKKPWKNLRKFNHMPAINTNSPNLSAALSHLSINEPEAPAANIPASVATQASGASGRPAVRNHSPLRTELYAKYADKANVNIYDEASLGEEFKVEWDPTFAHTDHTLPIIDLEEYDSPARTERIVEQASSHLSPVAQLRNRASAESLKAESIHSVPSDAPCPSPFSTSIAGRIYALARVLEEAGEQFNSETRVANTLGEKSAAFNNISFDKGGGCVINHVKRTEIPLEEREKQLAKKMQGWEKTKEKYDKQLIKKLPPQPKIEDISSCKVVKRNIELHPAGGMHSGYMNHREQRGSYVRIRDGEGRENRYARHGFFENKELYNRGKLQVIRPVDGYTPDLVQPAIPKDGDPTPEQANLILETLFTTQDADELKDIFVELSQKDNSWEDIAKVCRSVDESRA